MFPPLLTANRTMKPSFAACLAMLGILLFAVPGAGDDSRNTPAKTSIPEIARIGKAQIGYSTQADLAALWGEGKTIIGGHPNSGRLWRVKGTCWLLDTDGFEYS